MHPYTSGGPTHQAFGADNIQIGDLDKLTRLLARQTRPAGLMAMAVVRRSGSPRCPGTQMVRIPAACPCAYWRLDIRSGVPCVAGRCLEVLLVHPA